MAITLTTTATTTMLENIIKSYRFLIFSCSNHDVTGMSSEATVHGINDLATWMIEHPLEAEDDASAEAKAHGSIRDFIHSDPSTPQTPEVNRVPFVRER